MSSLSMGVSVLCLTAMGGVGFLVWALYHFILDDFRMKRRRQSILAVIDRRSKDFPAEINGRKIVLVGTLLFLTGTAAAQTASTPKGDTETEVLEQKVESMEHQLEELKEDLQRMKAAHVGSGDRITAAQAAPAEMVKPQEPEKAESVREPLVFPDHSTINVLLDGYYGFNFNHPPGRVNSLRAYDVLSNSFSLNQADVVFELPVSPEEGRRFGARLDLQFGQATDSLQGNPANESRPDIYRNIFQAYGRYVAPVGKGLTIDFGKWASSLGYEGNYTKDQLNYTRAFFFYYLPFYHMGVRTNYKLNDTLAVNYWLTNGTQQSEAFNSFKDEMFGIALTPGKSVSWNVNYYLGQEHPDTKPSSSCTAPLQPGLCIDPIVPAPDGRTHIFDSYLSWQVNPKLLFGVEGDYVIQRLWKNAGPGRSSAPSHVDGGAAYLQYQFNPRAYFAARTEYLSDRGGLFSGTTQALKETTGTFKYTFSDHFIGMAEYRRDWSNQLFFPRGTAGALVSHQDTATLGLIWWYGGKQGAW